MVGIVVVSHSRALAAAAVELAEQMLPAEKPPIAIAAGLPDGTLGTDATAVQRAIEDADRPDGVVVLLDLGSAVLSTDMALELLDADIRERVIVSPAPLVEGLVAAAVVAAGGGTAQEVAAEAAAGLAGKQGQISTIEPRGDEIVRVVTVRTEHGLHARPAARLATQARNFDATVTLTNRNTGAGPVPANSLTRIATLGVRAGDEIAIAATGPQAAEAVDQLVALAERDFDEEPAVPTRPAFATAIGKARQWRTSTPDIPSHESTVDATQRLDSAVARTRRTLTETRNRTVSAIFDAHLGLLDDIAQAARQRLESGPAHAIHETTNSIAAQFERLTDPYQRTRAADVRAVGDQLLGDLLGTSGSDVTGGILIAPDLTPAEAATVAANGVVLAAGGPTSHAAIMLRSRGIPFLTGAGDEVLDIPDGTTVAIKDNSLFVDPGPGFTVERSAPAEIMGPALTTDGVRIPVAANIGSVADAHNSAEADGAGLVRTEFLFQGRPEPPSVDEQEAIYREIAAACHPAVFRTLDAGADKPLPFLPAEPGLRGLRLTLRHPDVLRPQLRALSATPGAAIMFPLVSTVDDIVAARELLDAGPRIGMMVEVPAAALNIAAFVPYVDFFSIGTNDLTQYALAADRQGGFADPLEPGVLRLIDATCRGAGGKPVSVCGEIAADPVAVPILLGLGVGALSVAPPAVRATKHNVGRISLKAARELARQALQCGSAAEVRALAGA